MWPLITRRLWGSLLAWVLTAGLAEGSVGPPPTVDLGAQFGSNGSTGVVGQPLLVDAHINNLGPNSAPFALLVIRVPSPLSLSSVTPAGSCAPSGGEVVCAFTFSSLSAGATVPVFLTLLPTAAGMFTLSAIASSPVISDPNLANNTAHKDIMITAAGCGNNRIEPGELCDPPGSACLSEGDPGICSSDCNCTLSVSINIQPDNRDVSTINLESNGVIPLAILSTATFDAPAMVAFDTVCFGSPTDPTRGDCTEAHGKYHGGDVNGDGRLDLMLHFNTQETNIGLGDTQACVNGMTVDGREFGGCDSIRASGRRLSCGRDHAFPNPDPNPVVFVISLTDDCPGEVSEIQVLDADGDIVLRRLVEDGQTEQVSAEVPAGGEVVLRCIGDGAGSCPFVVRRQ